MAFLTRLLRTFAHRTGAGRAFLVGLLCAGCPVAGGADALISREYKIKAAFLYNFTKFVEWPAGRFQDEVSPIVIGVLGRNPFGGELAEIVRGRKINGRGITIVALESASKAGAAHAVFIAAGEEKRLGPDLEGLIRGGVLLVGESVEMAALGSTVTFTTTDDRVRFEINMVSAARGGLKISAELQKLATAVRRSP